MKIRFNPVSKPLYLNIIDATMTDRAKEAFYYIANLMYNDYTDDEVIDIFSEPKQLADDVSDMLNELADDDDKEYKKALAAVSCVLLKQLSK